MRKYYLKVVFFIALFTIPLIAKAECNYNEQVKLQKMAGNVSFSYRYKETKYSVIFEITVSNLTNEIYMIDRSTGRYYYSNNTDFTLKNYQPGETIQFDFYAKNASCTEAKLFTSYVTLPAYNPFYTNTICNGIEGFELCQKWLKHNMTYKEFYDGVTKYLNTEIIEPQPEVEPKEEFNWEVVIDFWAKYYIYFLLTIIIVGGVILYLHDKKSDL